MSGVQSGDRLERLYRLRDQVNLEIQVIEHERAMTPRSPGLATTTLPKPKPAGVRPSDASAKELLAELGATTKQVKRWAVDAGLLPAVARGRVARSVIEDYAAAVRAQQEDAS